MVNHTTKITRERGSWFFVVSEGQQVPLAFSNLVTAAKSRRVIRLAGGCKGLTDDIRAGMVQYFLDAFRLIDDSGATTYEFDGTVMSGGTASFDEELNLKDVMITNIPGYLAEAYPCIAISTTPRTADMSLHARFGNVIVDKYGGQLDHRQHANLVVQKNPADILDWDGDLALYLTLLEGWSRAGFAVAVIAINGGAVTKAEIYGALSRGIPVIAVEGSLRETDVFIQALRQGKTEQTVNTDLVSIVKVGDAPQLREALKSRGLLV